MNTVRNILRETPLAWLLFAVPIAGWLHHARPQSPLLAFVLACIAIVPLASQSVAFSIIVSVILLAVYLLSLVFSLGTHAHLVRGDGQPADEPAHGAPWSLSLAIAVMAVVTLLIVWMSEILVGTVEHAALALGLTNLFVGVVMVAVVGNAAEHSTAVLVAGRNRMELAVGSSTQIALLVTPLLVLLSLVIAPTPLSLAFSGVEVLLILTATFVASILIVDGKSTWFTGVQLIAAYLIMAITVFAIPAPA
jgi:Ca2+:H+ antiporter